MKNMLSALDKTFQAQPLTYFRSEEDGDVHQTRKHGGMNGDSHESGIIP